MASFNRCSACRSLKVDINAHPLLDVPICKDCHRSYNLGEFTIDEDGNEIYCRWCGEGGDLILCDACPKSFCSDCIENNFGKAELSRIRGLSNRWICYICSPQPLKDLFIKNNWKKCSTLNTKKPKAIKGQICDDISRGREKFEIPVINTVDKAPPPMDFCYITEPVAGEGVTLTDNPNYTTCCSCTDNCMDASKCECAQLMGGFAYDSKGMLLRDVPGGIYECNQRCSCHVSCCKNRLVGNGPHLRLEVFRCSDPTKGWGVRCKTDIYAGTYVADYIGEILPEEAVENRGLTLSDEYLFTLDSWGRSQACQRLTELGMKGTLRTREMTNDMDITCLGPEDIAPYLDPRVVDRLVKHGAVDRAIAIGKELREDPDSFFEKLNDRHNNQNSTSIIDTNLKKPVPKVKRPPSVSKISTTAVKGDKRKGGTSEDMGNKSKYARMSWLDIRLLARQKALEQARAIITDRVVIETEEQHQTFSIDARWYGSVGRFFKSQLCSEFRYY